MRPGVWTEETFASMKGLFEHGADLTEYYYAGKPNPNKAAQVDENMAYMRSSLRNPKGTLQDSVKGLKEEGTLSIAADMVRLMYGVEFPFGNVPPGVKDEASQAEGGAGLDGEKEKSKEAKDTAVLNAFIDGMYGILPGSPAPGDASSAAGPEDGVQGEVGSTVVMEDDVIILPDTVTKMREAAARSELFGAQAQQERDGAMQLNAQECSFLLQETLATNRKMLELMEQSTASAQRSAESAEAMYAVMLALLEANQQGFQNVAGAQQATVLAVRRGARDMTDAQQSTTIAVDRGTSVSEKVASNTGSSLRATRKEQIERYSMLIRANIDKILYGGFMIGMTATGLRFAYRWNAKLGAQALGTTIVSSLGRGASSTANFVANNMAIATGNIGRAIWGGAPTPFLALEGLTGEVDIVSVMSGIMASAFAFGLVSLFSYMGAPCLAKWSLLLGMGTFALTFFQTEIAALMVTLFVIITALKAAQSTLPQLLESLPRRMRLEEVDNDEDMAKTQVSAVGKAGIYATATATSLVAGWFSVGVITPAAFNGLCELIPKVLGMF